METYGDLKNLINVIKAQKKDSKIKGVAIDTIIGSIPGAGYVKSAFDFYKAAIKTPDDKRPDSWLSRLDVDDEMSAIVDDNVENGFLKSATKTFEKQPDDKKLNPDFDMNQEMIKYLDSKYSGRTLTGIPSFNLVKEDTFDKFLKVYSYKFNKGYPDMNDVQDILLLENILKEDFDIVLESATSDTEDLHEIFTAMFVAGYDGKFGTLEKFTNANWEKEINGIQNLVNKGEHLKTINNFFTEENKNDKATMDKYWSLLDDAQIGANLIKQYMGNISGITRVFADGKKEKADIIARDSDASGRASDVKKGEGFLKFLSKQDSKYKEAFDETADLYISLILDNYDPTDDSFIGNSKRKKINYEEVLNNLKKETKGKKITWDYYTKLYSTKGDPRIKDALSYAYKTIPSDKKKEYEDSKRENINRSIEDFLESRGLSQATNNQEDIKELIKLIIGPYPNTSYLYGANFSDKGKGGGGKMFFMPSEKQIDANEYILSLDQQLSKKGEESANFDYLVTVKDKKTGKPLFEFDLLLRFGGGQWVSDVGQKGKHFKIFYDNFIEVFPPA